MYYYFFPMLYFALILLKTNTTLSIIMIILWINVLAQNLSKNIYSQNDFNDLSQMSSPSPSPIFNWLLSKSQSSHRGQMGTMCKYAIRWSWWLSLLTVSVRYPPPHLIKPSLLNPSLLHFLKSESFPLSIFTVDIGFKVLEPDKNMLIYLCLLSVITVPNVSQC